MLWWWGVIVRHGGDGVNKGGWWCRDFSKTSQGVLRNKLVVEY